jgi:Kdo2-lipid IVA lauroyltransferase/acyltransferase
MSDKITYCFLIFLEKIIKFLPSNLIRKIGICMGKLIYYIDYKHRRISLDNLAIAFPQMDISEKKRIARLHFENLGRTMMEFFILPRINKQNLTDYVVREGVENFEQATKKGKGIIFLSSHIGNWEIMAYTHSFLYDPANVLARKFRNAGLDVFINRIRSGSGNTVVDKKSALYKIIKLLKENGCIGILIDQSVHPNEAVYVDFFGLFTSTTPLITQIALKIGCSIIPVFDFPIDDGKHRVVYYPEVKIETPPDNMDIVIYNTERLNKIIESCIREFPEIWLWSHKRWKNTTKERCWGRDKHKGKKETTFDRKNYYLEISDETEL